MELFVYMSTVAGAGALASYGYAWLRQRVYVGDALYPILHSPFQSRMLVLIASAALASLSALVVASFGGPAADAAITTAWSFVCSQVLHAIHKLPTQAPFDGPEI